MAGAGTRIDQQADDGGRGRRDEGFYYDDRSKPTALHDQTTPNFDDLRGLSPPPSTTAMDAEFEYSRKALLRQLEFHH